MRINRLTVFNHLWAIAGFGEWTRWSYTETGWSGGLFLGALALLLFPGSVLCLALFAGVQIVYAMLAVNRPFNHGLFMAFMNLGILLAIARCMIESRGSLRERLVETFAPALRTSLALLYLFAFFHKLNTDFLDPDVSCTGYLLESLNRAYRILPVEPWAVAAGIAATLLIELGVPLLLISRRTAYLGLALGAAFHISLSQYGGLHNFAAMLFAVYFLFLPEKFTATIGDRLSALLRSLPFDLGRPALRSFVLPAIVGMLAVFAKLLGLLDISHTYRGLVFWDVWLVGVLVLLGRDLVRLRRQPATYSFRQRWAPLLVIPLLVGFNGMSPYLGLKTETSWSMYSNLRTEIEPNHLIVPESLKLFGYQDRLVEIVESSLRTFERHAEPDVRIPLFEFRRRCSAVTEDFFVRYRLDGKERRLEVVDGVPSDPEVCSAPLLIPVNLLGFRPVDVGPRVPCRH